MIERPRPSLARLLTTATAMFVLVTFAWTVRLVAQTPATFADRVDLTSLGRIAVHSNGRFKSLDSYATAVLQYVTGPHLIDGQSRAFTYLDLMFRPAEYLDRDVLYIGKNVVRERLAEAMLREAGSPAPAPLRERVRRFVKTGLISEMLLRRREVQAEVESMRRDLIKTARFAEDIDLARQLAHTDNLLDGLRIVPPPGGRDADPWLTLDEFSMGSFSNVEGFDASKQAEVRDAWTAFATAWMDQDAEVVNRAAARLASVIPTVNPSLYPRGSRSEWPWSLEGDEAVTGWVVSICVIGAFIAVAALGFSRGWPTIASLGVLLAGLLCAMHGLALILGRFDPLALESFYFNNHNWFTANWVLYMLAVVFLLMSVVYRWRGARWAGMIIFCVAFTLQTTALLLRWYVADRWPNSNMFEAVTTAAWFGGCVAVVIELLVRRTAMRTLFALGSAAASMTALMAAHFLPQALNANISNKMPVLDDVWLYIHTNVIIFSYCLIFMAAMVALVYLGYRLAARLGGFGGVHHYARVGGAGSLIAIGPGGEPILDSPKTTVGQVFDGATMILMELSFVLLWTGLVMGAMWADHSWGRPWGWDPKEVFALNTFIVFAILVHVRLKARDKGLWTALLVLAGCVVMLFNWIFINFKISGLHSYA